MQTSNSSVCLLILMFLEISEAIQYSSVTPCISHACFIVTVILHKNYLHLIYMSDAIHRVCGFVKIC